MLLANRTDGSARGPKGVFRIGNTLVGVGLLCGLLAGCGNDQSRPGLIVSVSGSQPGVNCSGAGCPCTSEGATTACGETKSASGNNVVCAEGTRSCRAGVWGACEAQRQVTKYAPQRASGGTQLLDLAESAVSCGDPCDPDCHVFHDSAPGLTPGPNLTVDGNGLTLPGREGGGSCSNLVLDPSSAILTVTNLRPTETDPEAIFFKASCGAGGPEITPSWILRASDADAARIDEYGILRAVSGVAKRVQVTGATAFGSATATVDIRVSIDQVDPACEATSDVFLAAPSGAEPGKTLYPYSVPARPVVFPLAFGGPLVQWSTGGVSAECVKISLDFPPGPTARFHWSYVFGPSFGGDPKLGNVDTSQPAAPIPDDVWGAFASAAAGQTAEITVQRHVAGAPSPLPPMPAIPVRFASDTLRGTAFFTQYLRRFRDDFNFSTYDICSGDQNGNQRDLDITDARYKTSALNGCVNADCSPNAGPACPVGNCTVAKTFTTPVVTLQALDLANPSLGSTPAFPAAPTGSRCVACHSISADGSRLVASDYSLSGVQTIARIEDIDGHPNASSITASPTYSWTSNGGDPIDPEHEQSKGLSYAALSPDGRFVLQGPNFWGNTNYDVPLGAGNSQNVGYAAGGKRYFLLDLERYRRDVLVATAGPLPTHTASGDTLTGIAPVPLVVDGVEISVGDSVLVKDEPNPAENAVYEVTQSTWGLPFRLARRADNGGSGDLAFGDKFRVQMGGTNTGKYFHIAEPVVDASTPLQFAMYSTVTAATSGALPPHDVDVGPDGAEMLIGVGSFQSSWVDDVPLDASLSILVKDETLGSAPQNGVYSLVDPTEVPWRLVRRAEADADPEVSAGMRVRVNQGTNFGGKTFVVANTGSITLGVTPLTIVADALLDEGTKYDRGGVQSTLPTMMYPSFSPDGSALVYVNGDADTDGTGSAATGWRRGLSLLNFNAGSAQPFSNKRRLLNTFNAATEGPVIKWPFFEPDSRGVVFAQSSPDEFCPIEAYRGQCTGPDCLASTEGVAIDSDVERACFKWSDPSEYGHGNGAPVTRGFWPGRLESVNTQSLTTAELSFLNDGLASQDSVAFAADGDKAYQPSVLPFTAGGYRWVVFTSTRAYGNQLNAVGTHFSCAAPLLWMAALDDAPAGGVDRSHPAFLMPGQNLRSILSGSTRSPYGRHYLNERGYVVPSACKLEHELCTIDSECCGSDSAPPSMQCRLSPDTDPPRRTCESASSCIVSGDSCASNGDCCQGLCVHNVCASSPRHDAATYERVFSSNCPFGYKVRWGNFEWHADAPSSTSIAFSVAASDVPTMFTGDLSIARADSTNSNPPPSPLQQVNVGDALFNAGVQSGPYLRVTMLFTPSGDAHTSPTLYDWNQSYDCLAAE